jgi:hypothetical protein
MFVRHIISYCYDFVLPFFLNLCIYFVKTNNMQRALELRRQKNFQIKLLPVLFISSSSQILTYILIVSTN